MIRKSERHLYDVEYLRKGHVIYWPLRTTCAELFTPRCAIIPWINISNSRQCGCQIKLHNRGHKGIANSPHTIVLQRDNTRRSQRDNTHPYLANSAAKTKYKLSHPCAKIIVTPLLAWCIILCFGSNTTIDTVRFCHLTYIFISKATTLKRLWFVKHINEFMHYTMLVISRKKYGPIRKGSFRQNVLPVSEKNGTICTYNSKAWFRNMLITKQCVFYCRTSLICFEPALHTNSHF